MKTPPLLRKATVKVGWALPGDDAVVAEVLDSIFDRLMPPDILGLIVEVHYAQDIA